MTILIQDRSMVTPGEVIAEGEFTIGTNVYREEKKIISQVIGLVTIKDNQISVVSLKGKYIPRVGDLVIGKVTDVSLSTWVVDIASPYPGILRPASSLNKRVSCSSKAARSSGVALSSIFFFQLRYTSGEESHHISVS